MPRAQRRVAVGGQAQARRRLDASPAACGGRRCPEMPGRAGTDPPQRQSSRTLLENLDPARPPARAVTRSVRETTSSTRAPRGPREGSRPAGPPPSPCFAAGGGQPWALLSPRSRSDASASAGDVSAIATFVSGQSEDEGSSQPMPITRAFRRRSGPPTRSASSPKVKVDVGQRAIPAAAGQSVSDLRDAREGLDGRRPQDVGRSVPPRHGAASPCRRRIQAASMSQTSSPIQITSAAATPLASGPTGSCGPCRRGTRLHAKCTSATLARPAPGGRSPRSSSRRSRA